MDMVGKLVANGLLKLAFTEYHGIDEFPEVGEQRSTELMSYRLMLKRGIESTTCKRGSLWLVLSATGKRFAGHGCCA